MKRCPFFSLLIVLKDINPRIQKATYVTPPSPDIQSLLTEIRKSVS